jgi:hypothetical protein
MSNPVDLAGAASQLQQIINSIDLGPTESVQFQFAKLQMAQAQLCKEQATSYMKQIEDIQAEQKKTAEMIAQARKLQNEAKTGDKCTTMPDEMVQFYKDRGLSYDTAGNDKLHNKDEWDYNIQSLTNYQESISNKTQTLMVYLQDFIGQYNSYTQGASNQVSQGIQTLTAVATAR